MKSQVEAEARAADLVNQKSLENDKVDLWGQQRRPIERKILLQQVQLAMLGNNKNDGFGKMVTFSEGEERTV